MVYIHNYSKTCGNLLRLTFHDLVKDIFMLSTLIDYRIEKFSNLSILANKQLKKFIVW